MNADLLQQLLGVVISVCILCDVFLTVLYARIGTGILSDHVARWTWGCFRFLARFAGKHRGAVLSFCGPTILVVLLLMWVLGLTCGMGLVIHASLGSAVVMTDGRTPTDFATALYVAGTAVSTLGASNFAPTTPAMRLFLFANSITGISVLTLSLAYLLQVYSALRERNTLGLKLHVLSRETGDAAEILAGVGPEGEFHSGYTILVEVAAELTALKEAHQFYPVLFYFRFRQPFYSVSHNARLVLDLVTLIWTAIDQPRYRWMTKSAAVWQLYDSAMLIMQILEEAFVPGGEPDPLDQSHFAKLKPAWNEHFLASRQRLRGAGIETVTDADMGAERYFEIRSKWQPYVDKLSDSDAFDSYETDPSTAPPSAQDRLAEQNAHLGL